MSDRSLPGSRSRSSRTCHVQEACRAFFATHAAVVALHEEGEKANSSALLMALRRRDAALQRVRRQTARTKHAIWAKLHVLHTLQEWLGREDDVVGEFALEMTEEMAPFFASDAAGKGCDEAVSSETSDERARWLYRLAPFSWFATGPKQQL